MEEELYEFLVGDNFEVSDMSYITEPGVYTTEIIAVESETKETRTSQKKYHSLRLICRDSESGMVLTPGIKLYHSCNNREAQHSIAWGEFSRWVQKIIGVSLGEDEKARGELIKGGDLGLIGKLVKWQYYIKDRDDGYKDYIYVVLDVQHSDVEDDSNVDNTLPDF